MISVIVPVLNEEDKIHELIRNILYQDADLEIIIVDGGSTDNTIKICESYQNIKVISSEKGRANQMNKGAEMATGDILLFLHADTLLPEKGIEAIEKHMVDPAVAGGSFYLKFDQTTLPFKLFTLLTRINNIYFTYGDQAIFIRRNVFAEIGAYKNMPILEDFEIQKRLRKKGRFIKLPFGVITSTRRFKHNGVWRQQLLNLAILCAYEFGVSPVRLKKYYSDLKR